MSSEAEPIQYLESERGREPDVGVGVGVGVGVDPCLCLCLCLSEGGYRAVSFHLGFLLRQCEIGYLRGQSIPAPFGKLERVSIVSGGSIPAPVCAQAWDCETIKLAATPTRLKAMDNRLQARLINWGYAACDAAVRKHVDSSISRPGHFPYTD